MTSQEFARLLRVLSENADFSGDTTGAQQLRNLAELFDSAAESSLNRTLVKRIRSSRAKDSQMFQRALRHLKFFRQATTEIARKSELNALDAAIEGLNDNEKQKRPPRPKPVPTETKLARSYLDQLEKAGSDREKGEKILEDIRANKAIDIGELNWLVQQYAGGSTVYATRPKAIDKIGDRLAIVARRGEKSDEIKRLTEGN
ncbi:MAG: hypothetical protein ACK4X1_07040 [Terricaulis sp.]